jgi:hypothetical protein
MMPDPTSDTRKLPSGAVDKPKTGVAAGNGISCASTVPAAASIANATNRERSAVVLEVDIMFPLLISGFLMFLPSRIERMAMRSMHAPLLNTLAPRPMQPPVIFGIR